MHFYVPTESIRNYLIIGEHMKVDPNRKNFHNIIGSREWFKPILLEIQLAESSDNVYKINKNRINFNSEPFLVINVYCNICKVFGKVTLKTFDQDAKITSFELILNNFHDEEKHITKPQIKSINGSERELLKQSILGPDNHGSAKMYREKMASEGYVNLPSNDVSRQIIREKKSELIPETDWINTLNHKRARTANADHDPKSRSRSPELRECHQCNSKSRHVLQLQLEVESMRSRLSEAYKTISDLGKTLSQCQ